MRGTIIQLKQISGGCPEQWEGKLSTGESVYARERHGTVRIELDDIIISEERGDDAYGALATLFEIKCEPT